MAPIGAPTTGNSWASRDDFADALDFMGWYTSKSQKVNGISKWDAYNQYLNYHEGWGGFSRGSHLQKKSRSDHPSEAPREPPAHVSPFLPLCDDGNKSIYVFFWASRLSVEEQPRERFPARDCRGVLVAEDLKGREHGAARGVAHGRN